MAQQTQYFEFNPAEDPFAQHGTGSALAVLVPKLPGQLRIDIHKETATVGRTDASDIVIAHKNVSKKHSEFSFSGGTWYVRDIGSTNGTFLNGLKISDAVAVRPGDTVSFGDQAYTFMVPGAEANGAAPPADDATAGGAPSGGMTAMFQGLFTGGQQPGGGAPQMGGGATMATSRPAMGGGPPQAGGATIMVNLAAGMMPQESFATLIEKSLTSRRFQLFNIRNRFGSAKTSDVVIPDPSVLPEHGEIVFEQGGRIRLRTMTQDIVVKVNGEPIRTQYIKDLDTLQIGELVFTFKLDKLPPNEMFGPASSSEAVKKGGGKLFVILLMLLVVGGAGAAGIYYGLGFNKKPAGGGSNAQLPPGATPVVTPDPKDHSFTLVEERFNRELLVEARDEVIKLDQNDARVGQLKLAIESVMEANELLDGRKVIEAAAALDRVRGTYESSTPVSKARDKINWQRQAEARESFNTGRLNYEAGRFDSARKQFEKADQYIPGYEEARYGSATMLAEASRLNKIATDALKDADELLRDQEYQAAAQKVEDARAEFNASTNTVALEKLETIEQSLNDTYNYALMMDNYQRGYDDQSISYFERLSDNFVEEQMTLRSRADRIKRVGELSRKAIAERSRELAEEVLALEADTKNAFNQQMARLKQELDTEKRQRAETFLERGNQYFSAERYEEAIEEFHKARREDETFAEATRRHNDAGSIILRRAYTETVSEKKRLCELVRSNCYESDNLFKQATNLLSQVQ